MELLGQPASLPGGTLQNSTGLSLSMNPARPISQPLSLLHLGYQPNGTTGGGWRRWMYLGTYICSPDSNTDAMYIGLRNRDTLTGPFSNRTDAVINWSDNSDTAQGPDNLKFVFTSGYNRTQTSGEASYRGLEVGRFTPHGRLGIGDFDAVNRAPLTRLHLLPPTGVYDNQIRIETGNNRMDLGFFGNTFGYGKVMMMNKNNLVLGTDSTERLRLDTAGNVGIGNFVRLANNTNPRSFLHLHKRTGQAFIQITNDSTIRNGFVSNAGLRIGLDTNKTAVILHHEPQALLLGTNRIEGIRMDTNRFVGIGNFSNTGLAQRPSTRLDVDGRVRVRDLPATPPGVTNSIVFANGQGVLHSKALANNVDLFLRSDGTWAGVPLQNSMLSVLPLSSSTLTISNNGYNGATPATIGLQGGIGGRLTLWNNANSLTTVGAGSSGQFLTLNSALIPTWTDLTVSTAGFVTGLGTQSNPISLRSGSALGEVITWTSSGWVAQAPVGDDWGTQTALTSGMITGTGIVGDSIRLRAGSAANQVLTWNGSAWVAAAPIGGLGTGSVESGLYYNAISQKVRWGGSRLEEETTIPLNENVVRFQRLRSPEDEVIIGRYLAGVRPDIMGQPMGVGVYSKLESNSAPQSINIAMVGNAEGYPGALTPSPTPPFVIPPTNVGGLFRATMGSYPSSDGQVNIGVWGQAGQNPTLADGSAQLFSTSIDPETNPYNPNTHPFYFGVVGKSNPTNIKALAVGGYFSASGAPNSDPDDAFALLVDQGRKFSIIPKGVWEFPSDQRLKDNVVPFTDGLAQIKAMEPKHFTYNGKGWTKAGTEGIGFIAQEVQSIAPYLVTSYKAPLNVGDTVNTHLLSMDNSALIYVAVNAIKELATESQTQDSTIAELKSNLQTKDSTISSLQVQLSALEARFAMLEEIVGGCCGNSGGSKNGSGHTGDNSNPNSSIFNQLAPKAALFTVFPNPTENRATVRYRLASAGPATLEVYDLKRQLVARRELNEEAGDVSLDFGGLAAGVYHIQLSSNGAVLGSSQLMVAR